MLSQYPAVQEVPISGNHGCVVGQTKVPRLICSSPVHTHSGSTHASAVCRHIECFQEGSYQALRVSCTTLSFAVTSYCIMLNCILCKLSLVLFCCNFQWWHVQRGFCQWVMTTHGSTPDLTALQTLSELVDLVNYHDAKQ